MLRRNFGVAVYDFSFLKVIREIIRETWNSNVVSDTVIALLHLVLCDRLAVQSAAAVPFVDEPFEIRTDLVPACKLNG
jgi:hypothetical protein